MKGAGECAGEVSRKLAVYLPTNISKILRTLVVCLLVASQSLAQQQTGAEAAGDPLAWTPFGNSLVLAGVAGYASGPVDRVWRTADGEVFIRVDSLGTFRTRDFVQWSPADNIAFPEPEAALLQSANPPLDTVRMLVHPLQPTLVFAVGRQLYRSMDGGGSFVGLTRYRGVSLLGERIHDVALNHSDPDDVLVATNLGLWRSRDGGLSWFPASTSLENLPLSRIVAFPENRRGLTVSQPDGGLLEWVPGSSNGWRQLSSAAADSLGIPPPLIAFGENLATWDSAGSQVYAGLKDGRLLATRDAGQTWREYSLPGWEAATQISANPADPQMAIALATDQTGSPLVLRTLNGGLFWEDVTPESLPPVSALAADWEQGMLLLAIDATASEASPGLIVASYDFRGMAVPTVRQRFSWQSPRDKVQDLRIDPSGTMLFAATRRAGVFFTALPANGSGHRVRHAADLSSRPAAPGDLLSIHGTSIASLRANGQDAAILGTGDQSTQVQLPYSLASDRISLELEWDSGSRGPITVPLRRVSPAIFLHPDGSPFVLHAGTGALIDENYPAVPGERIHLLLSGLGAVRPNWPAGLPVPADSPPAVIAPVEVRVNGLPATMLRATLAPGYAGIYLVEVVLPAVLDEGLSELQVVVDGTPSNLAPLHVAYP